MTLEIGFLFALLAVAVALFVSERVSFDVTALIVTAILMGTGILTVEEGLSGFSNQATITIGAMFVISAGFRQSGALKAIGSFFTRVAGRNGGRGLMAILLAVGAISAFINNTAAVAIFIPVFMAISRKLRKSPSRLLMPLSFISIFGGACTLIGTSTNILVSSIARDSGIPSFSMFEFAPMGLVFMAVGFVYLFAYGIRRIPRYGRDDTLTGQYRMDRHLYDLQLREGSEHIGKPLEKSIITEDLDTDVIRVFRGDESEPASRAESDLRAGDVIRVRGSAEEIGRIADREHVSVSSPGRLTDDEILRGGDLLMEVSVAPDSGLIGKRLEDVDLQRRLGAVVLAMRHRGKLMREGYCDVKLAGGDSLLLSVERDRVPALEEDTDFLVISQIEPKRHDRKKMAIAVAVLAGVIATAALNLLPIVVSAVAGALVLLLTGTITTRQAYSAVQWKVIFLLAGVLPLGVAMSETGAAELLADWVLAGLQPLGPHAVLSGFFLLAMVLTNIISNQASAVLLAPILIDVAGTMSVNPRTFLFALAFASSLSFATPVGYQTNTMIYNAGRFRFGDFLRIGLPLSALLWIVGSLVIPLIWPL